jgi:hypothetical protein
MFPFFVISTFFNRFQFDIASDCQQMFRMNSYFYWNYYFTKILGKRLALLHI